MARTRTDSPDSRKRTGSKCRSPPPDKDDGNDDDVDDSPPASPSPSRKNLKKAAASTRSWKHLPSPDKSPVDPNEYRLIRLNNGVKALLVSKRLNDGNAHVPWVSVYPESTTNSAHGLRNMFQSDFQDLEATRNVDSHQRHGNLYSHTPSTTSGTSLWSSTVTSSASEANKTEKYLPTFHKSEPESRSGGGGFPAPLPTCAVSLMLGVGSHHDPYDFPGLAHLCEHLVHHGSKNFPKENEYHQSVEMLGGGRNAFTDKGKTNYHFLVMQDQAFAGPIYIMRMLADLIANPLFPLDSVRREIESVDNEYFMRKSTIHFRRDHLVNQLLVQDRKHPLRTFAIGSKEKLMPDDMENSAERLRDALVEFHKEHYHAGNITMVVQACLDLDSLENCVGQIFSEIPKRKLKKTPSKSTKKTPYHNDSFNRLLTIKPLDDSNHLTIMWAFPPEAGRNYETKPLDFIAAYFDDSSPGGVEAYLKNKNLALKLAAGCPNQGPFRNDYVSVFLIDVILTSHGRDEIQEVLKAIFSYLEFIREEGVTKEAYKHLQDIDACHFNHFCPSSSLGLLVQLSDNLRWCEDEEVLYGHLRLFDFDKKLINTYLNELTPSQAHYTLVTRNVGKPGFPNREEIYGTEYLVQNLPASLLKALENVDIYDEFELPNWGASVPERSIELQKNLPQLEAPELLVDETYFKFSYFPTLGMRTPQAGCIISLGTPWLLKNCVESGVADIWKLFLQDAIGREIHPWLNLGTVFQCQFMPDHNRFVMTVAGLNYKLDGLIDIILRKVATVDKNVSEQQFYEVKKYVVGMYEGAGLDSTWLSNDMLNMLRDSEYHPSTKISEKIKRNLTYKHFTVFAGMFKQNVEIEMLLIGNATRADAREICDIVLKKRYFGLSVDLPIASAKISAPNGKRMFPTGERSLRIQAVNKESRISTINNHYVLGRASEENARMAELITHTLKLHLFSQLRTAQQLGYDVRCTLTKDAQEVGISIVVATHADKFCPCDVDARIDDFLYRLYDALCKTQELTVEKLRASGISRSREEFLDFYFNGLTNMPKSKFRKVSVQVLACRGKNEETCVPPSPTLLSSEPLYDCKKSIWIRDHKQTAFPRLILGVDDNTSRKRNTSSSGGFFISDIRTFHRMCDRY